MIPTPQSGFVPSRSPDTLQLNNAAGPKTAVPEKVVPSTVIEKVSPLASGPKMG